MRSPSQLAILFFLLLTSLPLAAQEPKPRLVVVVSVDQFCQDYLLRFQDNLSDDGLVRWITRHGTTYRQCLHQHAFTYTAPGHAVQLTGTYPNIHGIIGNTWYDRETNQDRYCVADESVQVLGGLPGGKPMSPRNLAVETVGDVLRLTSNQQSKVFGVAIKDRAAILMSGKNANGAFWLEKNQWVTTSYYGDALPGYLRVLNTSQAIERFRDAKWELLLPPDRYHNSGPDENAWENPPKGMTNHFPHLLNEPVTGSPDVFGDQVLFSPFGNDYTLQAAQEIVIHEKLGADPIPDLLTINLSSNDYVGHAFGPHSLEVEDMVYRTDLQLAEFARFLDREIGSGNWTLAVTADHGVAPIVEYATQFHLPAARNPLGPLDALQATLEALLRNQLKPTDPKPLIEKVEEAQVFLDRDHPDLLGQNRILAEQLVKEQLLKNPLLYTARTRTELMADPQDWIGKMLHRTLHPSRSGDVLIVYAPYVVPGDKGTTHGSPWHYDRHVPMLLLGFGIHNTTSDRHVSPAALAPTLSRLLQLDFPSGNVESPLEEALHPSNPPHP